jgi:hypothetical protein
LLLASEVLYLHWGGGEAWGFEEQGLALFSLAKRLLQPTGCFLCVYTPRYRGMARGLRAAAQRAGVALRTIARRAILTPALAATHAFTDTRVVAVAPSRDALQHWLVRRLGDPPPAAAADDSEEEGEEAAGVGVGAPLASVRPFE